jgi:hypothetical protein
MISSKIIIPSLMAVSIITILNSSNLFTDQIVYAQTVIDKLNVRNETTAIEFNPVNEEMFVVNKGNISVGKQPERILYLPTNNLLYVSSRNGSVSL